MDRALDDLVGSRGGNRRGGGGAFRRRGGFGTQQRRQGGFGASFQHDDRSGGDAMDYEDDRTGGGVQRRTRGARRTTTPYSRSTPGSIETSWKHDLYQDEEEFEDFDDDAVNDGPRGLETGTKVQITNLAYSVLSEDLKDLFESVGDIKRATVHFDKSGRSLGKATVVFSRRGDAVAAVKKYNNVPLDDQPMKISLLGNAVGGGRSEGVFGNAFRAIHDEALTISVGAPRTRRVISGGLGRQRRVATVRNVRVGGGGGGGFRGRTGGRGRGRGGAGRKERLTAEELDAEMDAYNQEA